MIQISLICDSPDDMQASTVLIILLVGKNRNNLLIKHFGVVYLLNSRVLFQHLKNEMQINEGQLYVLQVKAECPLCKQPFKSIIHNVRSYNMYDQFYLEHRASPQQRPLNRWYWDRHAAFRFMIPFNVDHRYMRHRWDTNFHLRSHAHRTRSRPSDLEPSLMRPSRRGIRLQQSEESRERDPFSSSRHLVSTIDFRRRLYLNGYRVTGVQTSLRYRHISPEFFRNNPAQTHRLIPWLNRELNALLYGHESQVCTLRPRSLCCH